MSGISSDSAAADGLGHPPPAPNEPGPEAPAVETRPRLTREEILATCERGIDLCRSGALKEGFATLASLGDITRNKDLPSAYFSYMGLGLAKYRNQLPQGIKLCRHAIKLEFFQTEHYVNLARICLLQERYRRDAVDAVKEGLRIDPENVELIELGRQLGQRKPPVLTFLGRTNPLNQALGWIRHRLTGGPKAEPPAPAPPPNRRTRGAVVSLH